MSPKAKQDHVEAWRSSGLTKSAYSRAHGLNSKTFGRWCRLAEAPEASSPAFLPVNIKSVNLDIKASIKLNLPAGGVLELPQAISPQWLGELLRCLN